MFLLIKKYVPSFKQTVFNDKFLTDFEFGRICKKCKYQILKSFCSGYYNQNGILYRRRRNQMVYSTSFANSNIRSHLVLYSRSLTDLTQQNRVDISKKNSNEKQNQEHTSSSDSSSDDDSGIDSDDLEADDELRNVRMKTPKGMRDILPSELYRREKIIDVIRMCFKRHGGSFIETPVCELKRILDNKYSEEQKKIFDVLNPGHEELALRYDLTVPFARFLGQNYGGAMRRAQIAKVYRRDKPIVSRGRFREFYQCDFDISGQYDTMIPDSECLRIIYEVLTDLDLDSFFIKINHRMLLYGIFHFCGVPPEKLKSVSSSIDKLGKLSWDEVKEELCEKRSLAQSTVNQLEEWIKISGDVKLVEELLNSKISENSDIRQGLQELQVLVNYCKLLRIEHVLKLDLSLARGLDYYTGVIFEAILTGDNAKYGSIAAGGRYDNLVGDLTEKVQRHDVPCVGVSIGIERIFSILADESAGAEEEGHPTQVVVASIGRHLTNERISLITELWDAKINAEHSNKTFVRILDQFLYCEKRSIPLLIIIGEDELKQNVVKLRFVRTRDERILPRSQCVDEIKRILNQLNQ